MFKQNVSGVERVMRIFLGLAIIWGFGLANTTFILLFGSLAGVYVILTGVLGYDHIYSVLGIDTSDTSDTSES